MYAHFELDDELGLDEDGDPLPTFVVRTGSKRRITVRGNAGDWKVDSDEHAIATARVVRSLGTAAEIEIHGRQEGDIELHAYHGRMSAKLFVRVVEPHEISVNFHYFTAGPSQSDLSRAQAVGLLAAINNIYMPQSYVTFRLHRMDPIDDDDLMALDFATKDQTQAAEQTIWDALHDYLDENYPVKSQRNVFFVKTWGARDRWTCGHGKNGCSRRNVMGTNPIRGNLAIIETGFANAATRLPQLVAHELGHSLGLHHTTVHPKNLMHPDVAVANVKIIDGQLRTIEKWL